jgi:hypothetical protein
VEYGLVGRAVAFGADDRRFESFYSNKSLWEIKLMAPIYLSSI